MNTQELKEKVFGAIEEAGKFSVLSIVSDIFDEYEKSNKSESAKIKFEPEYYIHKEIEDMKKSITCLDNRIDNRGDSLDNKIDLLEKEIEALKKQVEAIDKIKIIDNSIEPKQERFYYENIGGTNYQILDSKLKCCFDNYYSKHASIEICKAMNSLEASKNETSH